MSSCLCADLRFEIQDDQIQSGLSCLIRCVGVSGGDDASEEPLLNSLKNEEGIGGVPASEVLASLGIWSSYEECRILLYPEPVVRLILAGTWREVLFSSRWHNQERFHPTFPPTVALTIPDRKAAPEEAKSVAPQTASTFTSMARNFRKWSPAILQKHREDLASLESML